MYQPGGGLDTTSTYPAAHGGWQLDSPAPLVEAAVQRCLVPKQISRLPQAQLLLDEADKRLESCARRLSSIEQRLGILVGSAAIAGTLATATNRTGWTTCALGAIVVAAILGVIGLTPRTFLELPWDGTRAELAPLDVTEATLRLTDRRHDLAIEREKPIRTKAVLLTVGFSFLAVAVALLFASTLGIVVAWK